MPLRTHLADERIELTRTPADVLVDLAPGRPVLLPGDGAEAHLPDEKTQRAMLEGDLFRRAVYRLTQPDDLRVTDRPTERHEIVQRGGGVDRVDRSRVMGDPPGNWPRTRV